MYVPGTEIFLINVGMAEKERDWLLQHLSDPFLNHVTILDLETFLGVCPNK